MTIAYNGKTMHINTKTRITAKLQSIIFVVLLITSVSLIAWLSLSYDRKYDWTSTGRYDLSSSTIEILQQLDKPLTINIYIDPAKSQQYSDYTVLLAKTFSWYQKYKEDISLEFHDVKLFTREELGARGYKSEGDIIFTYNGENKRLLAVSERGISSVLFRFLRGANRKLVFVTGHAERDPFGRDNFDYGLLSQFLSSKGFDIIKLNLVAERKIPEDIDALIIASPTADYLDTEINLIHDYVKQGGNLVWLHDPFTQVDLDPVRTLLGIDFSQGVIIDKGIVKSPTVIMTGPEYITHPITSELRERSVFIRSTEITFDKENKQWHATPLFYSYDSTWLELDQITGTVEFKEGVDKKGPIVFAYALSRPVPTPIPSDNSNTNEKNLEQRVLIVGDSDFLSNGMLESGVNLELADNIANWITKDDSLINIKLAISSDIYFDMDEKDLAILGLLYLFILISLISTGIIIRRKRRKR